MGYILTNIVHPQTNGLSHHVAYDDNWHKWNFPFSLFFGQTHIFYIVYINLYRMAMATRLHNLSEMIQILHIYIYWLVVWNIFFP